VAVTNFFIESQRFSVSC